MKRRTFIKLLPTVLLFPACKLLAQPEPTGVFTYGGFFLSDNPGCYEFKTFTGNELDKDAFFETPPDDLIGRGWYVFVKEGTIDATPFMDLFEACTTPVFLPAIMRD